ncbi:MAG TPA: amino acid adenylation domain-containing protein, partial [Pyrinomonadaceae bacterium]
LSGRLRELSRAQGATLYMVLLAAFKVLLYRWTGQEDILVGTPIAGRTRRETEDLIGFFVNTLVLRTQVSGELSFQELVGRVREATLGAFTHQDVPFEKLVEELQPERDLSRTPFFQVMFILQNASTATLELPGLQLDLLDVHNATEKFDLSLSMQDTEQGLCAVLQYNTDLFGSSTISRFLAHYKNLLSAIVANPAESLSSLPMLTDEETHLLLDEWKGTRSEYAREQCLHEMFAAQAARTPDAIAVVYGDEQLTYAELEGRANQLARHLRSLGVGAETRVGLYLSRTTELVVAMLGILKAGGAYVPLDAQYPAERVAFMLADSGAQVVLTEQALIETLPASTAQALCLDTNHEKIARQSKEPLASATASDNLAYVIYTSGSTGRPKGVAIEHRAAVAMCMWANEVFTPPELERVLASTSICFDLSVYELFVTLGAGGAIVLADNALGLPALPAAYTVTLINTVPSAIAELLRIKGVPESARVINLAGEALPQRLVTRLYEQETVRAVYNLYGPSEDTTYSTWMLMRKGFDENPPIGRPISNTQAYVLDKHLRPVAIGVSGELYLSGAGLSRGYLNRPDATGEKYLAHPFSLDAGARMYQTGDIVRYRPDGVLEYLGRGDYQVKVRGFRIELGEIETALNGHPAVGECVVVVREDAGGSKHLAAYVVAQPDQTFSVGELRSFLGRSLPAHMIPSVLMRLDSLPLTPNGKINRRALPAPVSSNAGGDGVAFVAPRTPVEEIVAGIWATALELEQVGINDNFFELGGHSLVATRVVSRIREAFEVELPLRSLFESPTVEELSKRVEEAVSAGAGLQSPHIRPVSRAAGLQLSFAQQRLWFLDQLEPHSPAYNIPATVRFNGALNIHALEQSLNEVTARHESLRTTFGTAGTEPVQIISPPRPVTLALIDAAALGEAQIERLVAVEAARPFDLTRGPLLRACLLGTGKDEYLLVLTMHHIISDGWSTGVLVREAATLYRALTTGSPSPLAELPVQYADYAGWQRDWLKGGTLDAQLAYWRRQLDGAPAALELMTDRPRAATSSNRNASEPFVIPATLAQSFKHLSRLESATFYMTLLAAFKVLLYRWTGQEDILVGTPIAGRTRRETEDLIGFFVNTLVLRTQVGGELSFRELVGRVREATLGAFTHQDVPFEKLVEELQPERDLSRTPFFQVMFVLQNNVGGNLDMPGLQTRLEGGANSVAKFDLMLVLQDEPDGSLSASLNYNAGLFEPATIRRMATHFEQLLQGIALDSGQSLSGLPMLTDEETHLLLDEWKGTRSEYAREQCLHEMFAAQAARTPDAIAVVYGDEQLTYAELDVRANRLARHLRTLGVGAETPVAIMSDRSGDMIVGLVGILKAGGAYVPLDPQYPQPRLKFMLEDAGARVVLTRQNLLERLPEQHAQIVCFDTDAHLIAAHSGRAPASNVSADNLAYIIYTSGSTGRPKGVSVPHRAVARLVKQTNYAWLDADQVFLQYAPLSFDASTFEVWGSLLNGARLVVMSAGRSSLEELGETLRRQQVTTLWLTAGLFHLMVEERPQDLRGVRQLLAGGDVLSPSHVERVLREVEGCRVINGYGPTENTTFTCCNPSAAPDAFGLNVSIGRAISNTEVYVLDRNLRAVPVGVAGELCAGGDGLARGYLNHPELTAEKFIPHVYSQRGGEYLYRTGDLVRYLPDGNIEFLGRLDAQVKVRGFRIELGEIEAALGGHPSIRESVVVAHEPKPGDKQLAAYVVCEPESAATVADLHGYLKGRLPGYMIPSAFMQLDCLPLTPNGKVDRQRLPAPEQPETGEGFYIAPQTPIEEVLAGIWADVLGLRRRIGVEEDFFELGGHSLLATRAASRVREAFAVEVPLRFLFEQPTIKALAERIEKDLGRGEDSQAPALRATSREGELMLSYAQQRLWFLEQLQPGRSLYNMCGALRMKGTLDEISLQQSLDEVVRRHESLRTNFGSIEGRPVQIIVPEVHVGLPVADLRGLPLEAREECATRLMSEEEQKPFDLLQAPLVRARLLRLSDSDSILLLTLHHISGDGWSTAILIEELSALYTAFHAGSPSPLAPLPVQYADFANWQRHWLSGTRLEA